MSDTSETTQPLPTHDVAPADTGSGRHPANVGHLVMGIAFVGLALVWALFQGDVVQNEDVRWLLPVPWVLAGAAGLAATAFGGHRRHATRQTGWVDGSRDPRA